MVLACWASSFSNQHPSSLFQGFNLQPFNLTLTKVKGFQLNPCWLVVVKQICCLDVKRQFNSSMLSGFGSGNNDLYETRILSGKAKDHLSSSWFSAFFKAQPSCLSLRPYMWWVMCRIEAWALMLKSCIEFLNKQGDYLKVDNLMNNSMHLLKEIALIHDILFWKPKLMISASFSWWANWS